MSVDVALISSALMSELHLQVRWSAIYQLLLLHCLVKGVKGGTLDFEVPRHFSEESGVTQQLYIF